jgi:hypothetical protein
LYHSLKVQSIATEKRRVVTSKSICSIKVVHLQKNGLSLVEKRGHRLITPFFCT